MLEGVCDDARALAEPQGIKVEATIADHLPVKGDRKSLALIAQNLVENAVKYNREGGSLLITAQLNNGSAEVTVRNNGMPIPPERVDHIFERFYRARTDARISGSGLGLSIASELTKAHNGQLDLVRSDHEWTEFRLRIPADVQTLKR
mgnify:CR=1 FL=1